MADPYIPQFYQSDAIGSFGEGQKIGNAFADMRRQKKSRNLLSRIYSGDQSAIAELKQVDPELGYQAETQAGLQGFYKSQGPETALAGQVRPGDDALTTRKPATFDAEGADAYLASRGESGAMDQFRKKAGERWLGTTRKDAQGNEWGVTTEGWKQLPFETPEAPAPKVRAPAAQRAATPGATAAPTEKPVKPVATSEGERNAAGFHDRIKMTGAEINRLEDEGGALPTVGTDVAGVLGDYAESKVMSDKQQAYRTAAMAWIRAKLRKESGAAIADSEAKSEYDTYFPVPGDGRARIELKRRLRQQAEQEMRTSAGRALPGEITAPGSKVGGGVVQPDGSIQPATPTMRWNPNTMKLEPVK